MMLCIVFFISDFFLQEHNDAYAHSVVSAVAAASGACGSAQHTEAVSDAVLKRPHAHALKHTLIVTLLQLYFLANIVQMCIQRGGITVSTSPVYAQEVLEAAISRGADDAIPAGHLHFKVLAGEIEKLSNSWGQLLLRLQQKNSGDAIDTLSESVRLCY